jgi:hypothetical protein
MIVSLAITSYYSILNITLSVTCNAFFLKLSQNCSTDVLKCVIDFFYWKD